MCISWGGELTLNMIVKSAKQTKPTDSFESVNENRDEEREKKKKTTETHYSLLLYQPYTKTIRETKEMQMQTL